MCDNDGIFYPMSFKPLIVKINMSFKDFISMATLKNI